MASFSPFVDLLAEIEDPRRAEGKLYRLPEVVLFAILAIVAGANSYRAIHSFIDVHLAQLRDAFGMKWRKAPAYTTIRGILRQLDPASAKPLRRRASTTFLIAAQRTCSAPSLLTRLWCWRILIVMKSPMRSQPYRPCSAHFR